MTGQTPAADPITPWLQIVLQLGALGVLALLAWQLPRLIAALKTWRNETETAHRAERDQIRTDHREALTQQRTDNKDALAAILKHCEDGDRRRDAAMASVQGELENLQELVERITGVRRRKQPPQPPATS